MQLSFLQKVFVAFVSYFCEVTLYLVSDVRTIFGTISNVTHHFVIKLVHTLLYVSPKDTQLRAPVPHVWMDVSGTSCENSRACNGGVTNLVAQTSCCVNPA